MPARKHWPTIPAFAKFTVASRTLLLKDDLALLDAAFSRWKSNAVRTDIAIPGGNFLGKRVPAKTGFLLALTEGSACRQRGDEEC